MSFLHPGFLYAAAGAAAIVVALHFLVAEQPRAGILPTVRFFPDVQVRATALTVRLSDLLLLLTRVAMFALIGAAFAQPQLTPSRSAILRILLVDISRDAGNAAEVRDSAGRYLAGAASVIVFDSVATEVAPGTISRTVQAMRSAGGARRRGSISSALIVALRTASRIRSAADSLELVLVSPLLAEETDSATMAIRALWPGKISLARVAGAREKRSAPHAATIEWADSSGNSRWAARTHPDTIGGIRFDRGILIYPFVRKWRLARRDTAERVVARWIDGEAAIVERTNAAGCVRSIAVPIPTEGDAVLRPSFARFFESIASPCAQRRDYAPISAGAVSAFAGAPHLAPTGRIAPEAARMSPLMSWLLASALLLALIELLVRRRGERSLARRDEDAAAEASVEYPAARIA